MRTVNVACEATMVQQVAAPLPWGHHQCLMERVKNADAREWYACAAFEHRWSRNVLTHQIETRLIERQGQALTNFDRTLPLAQSDLAQQTFKDPYAFEFLDLDPDMQERALGRSLLEQLRNFVLELGKGFAFVASQHRLEVAGQDFYLDLLFYHLRLRCFLVIDLKAGEAGPENAPVNPLG
jgi:predicted nuclease of restriction endonuclease-like (RecB) superfamily